jgi:ketosteroid isomerase-like protein
MRRWALLVMILILGGLAPPLPAEPEKQPADDALAKDLRAFRESLFESYKKRDLDAFLEHVHPNVVYTWQDATVCQGREDIRDYIRRMTDGPGALVQSQTTRELALTDRVIYGGNTVVGWGKAVEDFKLRDGRQFTLNSRWTATAVKEGDRWLVTGVHVSVNAFDNDVLQLVARQIGWWAGGGGLLAGLVIGAGLVWLLRRRPTAAAGGTANAR